MSPDLLGLTEIAELLGVSRRTVQRWLARDELRFPAPAETLARGRIWRRRDVERWAAKTLPLPEGRPPKQ